jgi:hypothetical protein
VDLAGAGRGNEPVSRWRVGAKMVALSALILLALLAAIMFVSFEIFVNTGFVFWPFRIGAPQHMAPPNSN